MSDTEVELQRIGSYTITRLLKNDITSSLYLGKQRKKDIVIKVFYTPLITLEAKEAFLLRAKQLKKLKDRQIVELHDAGFVQDIDNNAGDQGYLVMQNVPGETLRQRVPPGQRIPADEVKRRLSPIASALHYAHVSHILHGNLHPGNLLIDAKDNTLLTDFSFTLQGLPFPADQPTAAVPYMAPEQLQGLPTAASDQYALAVIAYQWLCGQRPYPATERTELLHQQTHNPLPSPCSLNSDISPAVEMVLLRALAFNPDERFQHIQAFADQYLRALMGLPLNNEPRHVVPSVPFVPLSPIKPTAVGAQFIAPSTPKSTPTLDVIKQVPASSLDNIDKEKSYHSETAHNKEVQYVDIAAPSLIRNVDNDGANKNMSKELDKYFAARFSPDDLLKWRYRIIEPVYRGKFSIVYKVKDANYDNKIKAIMEMRSPGFSQEQITEYAQAFKHRVALFAGIRHLNLPRIYEFFSEADHWYIVMDFIKGETLADYLNKVSGKGLPVEKVLDIGKRISSVLDFLHNQKPSISFGSIDPSNILITTNEHLHLINFSIVDNTDVNSDIYGLGVTLYQMLSGKDLSQDLSDFEPLQLGRHPVLTRLDMLIMQMLKSNKSENPGNIATIAQELQDIANEWSSAQTVQTTPRPEADNLPKKFNLQDTVSADLCQGGVLSQNLAGYEERPAQVEMATLVACSLTQETPTIIEAGTGTGKALDVDTPIPTPTGWKRMGDLVKGDFVFDEWGHPTRVTTTFDVMYHRKCYEVVFSDGSSLIADAEHEWASYTHVDRKWANRSQTDAYAAKNFVTSDQLSMLDRLIALSQNDNAFSVDGAVALIGGHHWSVYQAASKIAPINSKERPGRYPHQALLTAVRGRLARDLGEQRRDGRAYTLVTTERMAATLTVGSPPRANHAIAIAGPLELPDADLIIAPYFLGVWLGDGTSRSNQITTADPSLIAEIEQDGYTVRSLKSHPYLYAVDDENGKAVSRWQPGMTGRLRVLGLLLNKHIPAIYLRASEQQRRALLAGLLDTDGTVNRSGAVEFTTTNPRLAQDVCELVCSLGFWPSLRGGRARLKGKDCGAKWTISFTTEEQVFRLERKAIAHKERLRNYSPERNRFRYIVAVREVPSRPVRCIQVESQSHLYLAGRSMIPTHNSLAYLVPIVRSGKVAIISTANKALQEQLFYKDIPFVQQHIKYFDAALVKGIGNYVCIDRLESERAGLQFYAKNRDFMRLVDITNDPEAKFNGDFETLDFQLPGDIRGKVCGDSDQCAWSKCNFFSDCYVREMREKAARAQIIVVNHTLLLLDAAMDGFLLPERDVIVLDEAHHLEEEATRSFTITISANSVTTLLAQRMLKDHTLLSLQDEANKALMHTWDRLNLVADLAFKGRANLQSPVEEGLKLATVITDLTDSLRKQRPKDLPEKEGQLFDKLLKRTQNLAQNIRTVFSVDQPSKFVYYVERVASPGQRGFQLQVSAAPLDVTAWLKERLFDKCNVICTSATLATIGPNPARPEDKGPNFAYFRRRTGLDPLERPEVIERILPLAFDYESNALLYVPRDLPAPVYGAGSDDYTKAIAREMYRLVKLSQGRAFLLFSSRRMLDQAYELMAPHLDYPLLRQGDMPRIELTRQFREEKGAILFGLKSFWEGVDIAGETLSLVVIDKLPFDPPDDPVHEARVAQMKAASENWFGIYVLPQAVLRLKQGLGRLLRTRDDRGVMAILDTRLYTKGYGKMVLEALPPARRTASIKDVDRFFNEEPAPF